VAKPFFAKLNTSLFPWKCSPNIGTTSVFFIKLPEEKIAQYVNENQPNLVNLVVMQQDGNKFGSHCGSAVQ
jgi:hypothetical protein